MSARQAGFMTWAYLVSKVAAAKLLENEEVHPSILIRLFLSKYYQVFKQVITSYLTHVIRDSEPEIYNLGFESAGKLVNSPTWQFIITVKF